MLGLELEFELGLEWSIITPIEVYIGLGLGCVSFSSSRWQLEESRIIHDPNSITVTVVAET